MISRIIASMTILLLCSNCSNTYANRTLDRAEIVQIFETLTSRPKRTWNPSGTIRARHQEYKAATTMDKKEIDEAINDEIQAYLDDPNKLESTEERQQMKLEAIPFNVRYRLSNEYTMTSNVVLRYDGHRFYWKIDIESRTDSLIPGPELTGNGFTEEFSLYWNKTRVFTWDGDKYTNYFGPGRHATVEAISSPVNGPLTAGIVPWGYGNHTLEQLMAAQSTGFEAESDSQLEIHLTVINQDTEETFVLHPAKDYALKSYSVTTGDARIKEQNYHDYCLVADNWCPGRITMDVYDTTTEPSRLLASDVWHYNAVVDEPLQTQSFQVDVDYDTFIEDFRFGNPPLQYRYAPPDGPNFVGVDPDKLLQNRLEIAFANRWAAQNCATAALTYVCGEFGDDPSWQELAKLVHGQARSTSLLEMRDFARRRGLNGVVVTTDLGTLAELANCRAILHLPHIEHFVVVGSVDEKRVGLIDLWRNNFYYRTGIDRFNKVWNGTALLLSNKPIRTTAKCVEIDDGSLGAIMGAAGCQSCTNQCQQSFTSPCVDPGGMCTGVERRYYNRVCCEAGSGTCHSNTLPRYKQSLCVPTGMDCGPDGDWTDGGSIVACQ